MEKKFVVATPTEREYDALMRWAEADGYSPKEGKKPATKVDWWSDEKEKTIIVFEGTHLLYGSTESRSFKDGSRGPLISFSAFAAIKGIELGPSPVAGRLSEEYGYTVNFQTETVAVGCQKIPFYKVKEVYDLTQKHK